MAKVVDKTVQVKHYYTQQVKVLNEKLKQKEQEIVALKLQAKNAISGEIVSLRDRNIKLMEEKLKREETMAKMAEEITKLRKELKTKQGNSI